MRLTYMYYLIKNNYQPIADLTMERCTDQTPRGITFHYGTIDNWLSAKSALDNLSVIDYFQDEINSMLECVDKRHSQNDHIEFDDTSYLQFCASCNILKSKMEITLDFCKSLGLKSEQMGFDIKMPPTNDFNDFADNIASLKKVLQLCPYLNIDGESVEIYSVDIGSIWMKFAVASTAAVTAVTLSNLATLVDKSVKIRSHMLTYRQQQDECRMQEVADDLLENIIDTHNQLLEHQKNKVLKELQSELDNGTGEPLSHEEEEQLRVSMEQLIDLIDKGMEIYASVDSSDEIKDLFPTSDEIQSLPTPAKMLTGETDSDSE